jgi:hypothetical protein
MAFPGWCVRVAIKNGTQNQTFIQNTVIWVMQRNFSFRISNHFYGIFFEKSADSHLTEQKKQMSERERERDHLEWLHMTTRFL